MITGMIRYMETQRIMAAGLLLILNLSLACSKSEDHLRELLIAHSQLYDPHSARFRNLSRWTSGSSSSWEKWCGEINAKNRYGGYVGWQRFSLETGGPLEKVRFETYNDDDLGDLMDELYEINCQDTTPI